MELLYCISLTVAAIICAVAVLHPNYDDNLLQRIGMTLTCLGAIGLIFSVIHHAENLNPSALFASGVACFAVGVCWRHRPGQNDRRRITDRRIADFCDSFMESRPND